MSSDSELSGTAPPSDAILEKTLRDIVRKAEVDPITVKRVRTAAEERLGLDAGFFKSHDEWNEKSKEIIEDAFVRCNVHLMHSGSVLIVQEPTISEIPFA